MLTIFSANSRYKRIIVISTRYLWHIFNFNKKIYAHQKKYKKFCLPGSFRTIYFFILTVEYSKQYLKLDNAASVGLVSIHSI